MAIMTSLSHSFSKWNRRRKLAFLTKFIRKHNIKSVLVVGAIGHKEADAYQNIIERGLSTLPIRITFSGLDETSNTWETWVCANGLALPFEDTSFDLVFSNAVIEHVGTEVEQRLFVNEHIRVGKHWIFTTPNRLFPIESHTQVFFRHMSPSWTHPSFSRLLSKTDLKRICPKSALIRGYRFSPTFLVHDK